MQLFDYVSYDDNDDDDFSGVCHHEDQHVTRFTQRNGVEIARVQCRICGRGLGNKKKSEYDFENLPLFDDELRNTWNEKCRKLRETRWQRRQDQWAQQLLIREAERQEESIEWWQQYNQYLRSPEWRKIRQAVLKRDNYLCQACLRNKASHVHHLSYELYNKIGRSAAFELVAICRPCHEQIHPDMSQAQDELTNYNPYLDKAMRLTT